MRINKLDWGAGEGKATSMPQVVLDGPKEIVDRRCIYVIVYTNALRDRIKNYQIK